MPVPIFTPLYRGIIRFCDPRVPARLRPLWEHPAGPKTVFFWGPLQKWCLVIAGLSDTLTRPANKLSPTQSMALAATGFIWARYSVVITPKNYSLCAVNFSVGLSGLFQLGKIAHYRLRGDADEDILDEEAPLSETTY